MHELTIKLIFIRNEEAPVHVYIITRYSYLGKV